MIVGFMGKGGSGKTTLSSHFVRFLHAQGYGVLAIDADHNMDLLYNLGVEKQFPYLGDALPVIRDYVGLKEDQHYSEAILHGSQPVFSLDPLDTFTQRFSIEVENGLSCMASGPHTDQVLHGEACNHILSTPLKIYLPLLGMKPRTAVVLDMTAGMDAAGSGVSTGLDFVFVCSEPTAHGLRTARQIGETLDFFGVPFAFVLNKVGDDDGSHEPAFIFPANPTYLQPSSETNPADVATFEAMRRAVSASLDRHGDQRLRRSQEKFERNRARISP